MYRFGKSVKGTVKLYYNIIGEDHEQMKHEKRNTETMTIQPDEDPLTG